MSSELTPAEVRCHTNTSHFSAAFVEGVDTDGGGVGSNAGGLVMSWVQTRGRLEQGSGDAGQDLVARTSRCTPRARRTRPVLRRAASGSGSRSCTGWPTRCWRRSRSSISVREQGKAARPRSSRYCRPQAAFLSTGALLLRLNALLLPDGDDQLGRCCVRDAKALRALSPEEVRAGEVRHGLWVLAEGSGPPARLEPVDVMPYAVHGAYDCCSGSYGSPGAAEGFQMDRARERVVVTARRTGPSSAIAYSDDLFELRLTEEGTDGERRLVQVGGIGTEAQSGRGCKIPVAVGGGDNSSIVYHHRSPTESGDLWTSPSGAAGATQSSSPDARLTATMPLSLRRKLLTPVEVTVPNLRADCATAEAPPLTVHTQIFAPDDGGDGPLQPLLWLHGGPMCHYSYDCNPLLTYLARCGYLVMAPNFSGSTGNGPAFMDRVLGAGCGVADLSDCLACAEYLASAAARTLEPRLDLSRGVAVGGHSWGGYLALRCLLHTDGRDESAFGCGVAAAAIADWSVQQRHTEVRYYDRALLGGWVYEQEVAERARAASPASAATELRAPVLVLHGDKDVDVPFRQIPPLVEALGRSPHPGASVESHFYAGEGHGIAGTEAQADYLDRIRTFLRIHMKPWDFTDNPHGEVTAY